MGYSNWTDITALIGKTITKVHNFGDETIVFECSDGSEYKMYHEQDCCESVSLNDVAGGALEDLNGQTILDAYESQEDGVEEYGTSTWTFYTIRTNLVTLTLRWYGASNGYYSEGVSFYKTR